MANTEPNANTLSLWDRVKVKQAQQNIPSAVSLELTYRCNLRCVHCYVDLNEPDELSLDEWKNVINQLKAAGTTFLSFTGGEVFVRSDLFDILAYARQEGFVIQLLTNSTMVTPENARDLAKLRITDVQTSLYGATPDTHETVTKLKGSFERTLDGIKSLMDARIKPKVRIIIMESNVSEYSLMKELVTRLGAISQVCLGQMGPSKKGGDSPFQYEPSIETLIGCPDRQDIVQGIVRKEDSNHLTCNAGICAASVSPAGDVFPCITFPLKLGNLRESSFDSIWRLEPCAGLRYLRSMRRADLYACQTCQLAKYCTRCTGFVYTETGQMDGPSPAACRQAKMRWRLTQAMEATS